MADDFPKNSTELLSQIDREWTQLLAVIAKLSLEKMATRDSGGWSPKDNLAHLSAWMHFMLESYLGKKPAYEAMGVAADIYASLSEDGLNAVLLERNRDRSVADVLAELNRTYARVVETLKNVPYPDLMKPLPTDEPETHPLMYWVLANTSDHFLEHRRSIEKML